MGITVGNKRILSIPEQVAENTRRIEELEDREITTKHIYEYTAIVGLSQTYFIVTFVSVKDYQTGNGEIEETLRAVKENTPLGAYGRIASGLSAVNSEPVVSIALSGDDIELTTVGKLNETITDEDVIQTSLRRRLVI